MFDENLDILEFVFKLQNFFATFWLLNFLQVGPGLLSRQASCLSENLAHCKGPVTYMYVDHVC